MKQILSLIMLLLALTSTNANAWFIFIPGSVTSAISDAITGDEGDHCVNSYTKVGDTIRLPDGSYGKVKSLSSSNSGRCTTKLPIRALIEVSSQPVTTQAEGSQAPFSAPAMVQIPGRNLEIGKYEVTQAEWRAVMGSNPSSSGNCGNCPVDQVSWQDTQAFIQKLNTMAGKQYRLPTEEEWEYACYGGSQSKYCGGDDINAVAWHGYNSDNRAHPVGQKQANGYGLYDMSGNVDEWTNSCWKENCNEKVVRGGSYGNLQGGTLNPTFRNDFDPYKRGLAIGFRLARTLDAPLPEPVAATPPTTHVVATPSSNTLPAHGESAADRIRLLNSLYKEGVINQKDFETKKQEILKSM